MRLEAASSGVGAVGVFLISGAFGSFVKTLVATALATAAMIGITAGPSSFLGKL
jgi:hypothetical protein